jgi:hypothetical protein
MNIKISDILVQVMRPANLEIHRDYYGLHEYFEDGFTLDGDGTRDLQQIGITNCLLLEKNGVKYVCSFGEEPATLMIEETLTQATDKFVRLFKQRQNENDHANFMEFIKNFK